MASEGYTPLVGEDCFEVEVEQFVGGTRAPVAETNERAPAMSRTNSSAASDPGETAVASEGTGSDSTRRGRRSQQQRADDVILLSLLEANIHTDREELIEMLDELRATVEEGTSIPAAGLGLAEERILTVIELLQSGVHVGDLLPELAASVRTATGGAQASCAVTEGGHSCDTEWGQSQRPFSSTTVEGSDEAAVPQRSFSGIMGGLRIGELGSVLRRRGSSSYSQVPVGEHAEGQEGVGTELDAIGHGGASPQEETDPERGASARGGLPTPSRSLCAKICGSRRGLSLQQRRLRLALCGEE